MYGVVRSPQTVGQGRLTCADNVPAQGLTSSLMKVSNGPRSWSSGAPRVVSALFWLLRR